MASFIDCLVAKGQRERGRVGRRAVGCEGLAASPGAVPRGVSASLRQGRVGGPAWAPFAQAPPRASVSPAAEGLAGLGSGHQRAGLGEWARRCWGLEGGSVPTGGVEVGSARVGGALCSQGGCACGAGRDRDQFSWAGALEQVSGDSDSAGRWRWSLKHHFPQPFSPQDPGGARSTVGTWCHLCQGCDPGARVLPMPRARPAGPGLGGAPGQLRGSGDSPGLTELLPSPRPCRGEDLQAVRAGARGQQGSESPFQ